MATRQATVNDFAKYFNDLVNAGKGDYTVDITAGDGCCYSVYKFNMAEVYDFLKKVFINE